MASEAQTAIHQTGPKGWDWWRAGDSAVLLAYAAVVLWTLRYHEKWADEAQAWLIARDLDLKTIWFHELRYEGSPGLWHTILWVSQHVFHAGYGALGYIGAVFAIAGAAVLLFCAPFPRYVRWPLAFTYVMVYQYAVIARPYTMMPLLAFCAAMFFCDSEHPERITVPLILLAILTSHGTLIAGCLGVAYLVQAIKKWAVITTEGKRRYAVCIGLMVVTFLFVFLILKPTPDVQEIAVKEQIRSAPQAVKDLYPTAGKKFATVLSGAFLDYPWLSGIFVVLAAAWCWVRGKFIAFALPVGLLLGFYTFVFGSAHHHGTVFIAAITGLWIAWPTEDELRSFGRSERWLLGAMILTLTCLNGINIRDSVTVIRHEYLYPYSGAGDAAEYLRSVGADRVPVFGFLHGVVGVQAYFDHNLFANFPASYFHHGFPLQGNELNIEELHRVRPEYIVSYSADPQIMMEKGVPLLVSEGYELVHFSDGYYLYKRGVAERDTYFIFRRLPGLPDPRDDSHE